MDTQSSGTRVVLFGLDDVLASELATVLAEQKQDVYAQPFQSPPECIRTLDRLGADVVFCSSERDKYLPLLNEVSRQKPELPVIIVSRTPEVSEWLDAIEAGASDYCAAPFESSHIQWILDSTLKHPSSPVLYRTA